MTSEKTAHSPGPYLAGHIGALLFSGHRSFGSHEDIQLPYLLLQSHLRHQVTDSLSLVRLPSGT